MEFFIIILFFQSIYCQILGILGILKVMKYQRETEDYRHFGDLTKFLIAFLVGAFIVFLIVAIPTSKDILFAFFGNIKAIFIK